MLPGVLTRPRRRVSEAPVRALILSAGARYNVKAENKTVDSAFFAKITGRVQGVGFRYYARTCAANLNIKGRVRNMDDGSVEVWAEGSPGALAAFRRNLAAGSPYSAVRSISFEDKTPSGYKDFR